MSDAPFEITTTTVSELLNDAAHLFRAHQREAGEGLGSVDLDFPLARALEHSDSLVLVAGRSGASIVGYCVGILSPSLRRRGRTHCSVQFIYIDPEHRGFVKLREMQRFTELRARDRGASEISWLAPVGGAFDQVLSACDELVRTESLYMKELR